ncbi:MAG: hypothetical protein LBL80_04455 [Ruminococcus sp.]|jgi:membrane protein implicated in regulation of membrane protease activity|nr:hypothetical protein [Ruminococcus sp.]
MQNKRRIPLGDVLTVFFIVAVGLMWVFSDKLEINIISLLGLTVFAIALMINFVAARKARRKTNELIKKVDEVREHIGEDDDTNQKDKYYF